MKNRGDLTNKKWLKLKPLLPLEKPPTGRPANSHRRVINGILWVKRTGAPWRDMPERYGKWTSVASRFYRWSEAGIWGIILKALQQQADEKGRFNWELHHVDATIVRAHQHAAGAHNTSSEAEALGRSCGGFSTKIHARSEGSGKPVTFLITPGQQHESTVFEELMEQGAVKRPERGRPKIRPVRVVADRGYNSGNIRAYLRQRGIRYTIPRRSNESRKGSFDRAAYKERNQVERLFNRLKQFRGIATRYEKRGRHFLTMITIVSIVLWL